MTKGTSSFGQRKRTLHIMCKRCGKQSYHKKKEKCSSCGYPKSKMRRYNWSKKAKRRRTEGTGAMTHLRKIFRMKRNGWMKKQGAILKLAL